MFRTTEELNLTLIICDPSDLFVSSRVIALRWDIAPWSLVLDLNAELSEAPDAPLHRGWVVFCGVGDVHAPFENCRVPLGFWAYGYNAEQKDNGTHSSFSAQVCKFDNDDQIIDPQLKQFSVRSQKVIGIVSRNSAVADEYRNIDHQTRQGLGSDASFLHALRRTS